MLNKYGKKRICNPEKISQIRLSFDANKWKIIHEKTKNTIQRKYGNDVSIIWKYSSSIEDMITTVLSDMNILYTRHKFVGGKNYDIHIINTNILIEVNGDYWHANPSIYVENDIINYAGKGRILVNEIWKTDIAKKQIAEENGYIVIDMWENDIHEAHNTNSLTQYVLDKLLYK